MSANAPSELKKKTWLAPYSWEIIVQLNEALCQQGGYLHKPSSDGYEVTKKLWESHLHKKETFPEVMEFLFECHRKAPFCFLNGNTFVTIARNISGTLCLDPVKSHLIRSISGHIVAGTDHKDERKKLLLVLAEVTKNTP